MKKKILIASSIIAAILILCSFKYTNREGTEIPLEGQQMQILHFHGHSYVCYRFYNKKFTGYGGYGYGGASILHDPDCKCGHVCRK